MINNILHNTLIAVTNKFDSKNPLTFTAQEAGSTVKLTKYGSPVIDGLQYRTNKTSEWSTYTIDTVITLTNVDDYVQFQNTYEELSTSDENYVQFIMTGTIVASGNIQSMLKDSTSCTPYCYHNMFSGCTSLTVAPELPATNLAERCYQYMFSRCTSLTTAPELPATNLAPYCYDHMFYDCASLTIAPTLPATNLDTGCYYYMFSYCASLTVAPELPAPTLTTECYESMFKFCGNLTYVKVGFTDWNASATYNWLKEVSSVGAFECPEELPIQYDNGSYIPRGWTVETYVN